MKKFIAFTLVTLFFGLAQANTSVKCQATENSIFYGVSFELNESGELTKACSSTGGYGCLELACKKINYFDYECSRTYKRLDSKELVQHKAYVIISPKIEDTLVLRSIKEGSIVRAELEKLTICKSYSSETEQQ